MLARTWHTIYENPQPEVRYIGRILPAPHDRLVCDIKPCAVCGLTGEINFRGQRSRFVECSMCRGVDAHSACVFGHAVPSSLDDFVCNNCVGHTVIDVDACSRQLPMVPLYEMLNEGIMMIERFDLGHQPNIFKLEDGPWVDSCVVADAVFLYDLNVQCDNIRPMPTTRPLTWIENWGTQDVTGMYPEEIGAVWHRGAACTLEDCQYYDANNLAAFLAALRRIGDNTDVDGWIETWVADEECFPFGLPVHSSRSSRRMHTNAQGLGSGGLCVQNHNKEWWENYFTARLRDVSRNEVAQYAPVVGGTLLMDSDPALLLAGHVVSNRDVFVARCVAFEPWPC